MTEKRFRTGKGIHIGNYFSETIIDTETNEKYYGGIKANHVSSRQIVELLNNQEEQIKELEERNQRQYKRLKEVWDLIFDRNWEELEKKAIEIEENEKLLQKEHCDVE